MSSVEALSLQLENVQREKQRLEVENARLRSERPKEAQLVDAEAEVVKFREENERLLAEQQHLKGLYGQLLIDMQEQQAKASEWESQTVQLQQIRAKNQEEIGRLQAALEQQGAAFQQERCQWEQKLELETLRAANSERQKWEAREERLVKQLEETQRKVGERSEPLLEEHSLPLGRGRQSAASRLPASRVTFDDGEAEELLLQSSPPHTAIPSPVENASTSEGEGLASDPNPRVDQGHSMSPRTGFGVHPSFFSSAFMAQQLPPLAKFSGESLEVGETFQDWLDQFEMVATVCHWNESAKLVNLTTRLRGQAYAFYRSCPAPQRASYPILVQELTKRFTPVRLQAVQSSLFHERKQSPKESVDTYAQDLRRLFYRAYPRAQQGSSETEDMGRSVLSSQFVAGLVPAIKRKVAGVEGDMEQLLTRARFEEAKLKELPESPHKVQQPRPHWSPNRESSQDRPQRDGPPRPRGQEERNPRPGQCYTCGSTGHIARNCRWRGSHQPEEARGRTKQHPESKVAAVSVPKGAQSLAGAKERGESVSELRRKLQEAEVEEALSGAVATLHGVTPKEGSNGSHLGPTITSIVHFEGEPVKALLDTGSPVSIVSLEFAVKAMAKQRPPGQDLNEWKKDARARLQPPTLTLQSYGGGEINIVRQLQTVISKGPRTADALVQVQKGSPIDLLLGTDLLAQLGFEFLEPGTDGEETVTDLLRREQRPTSQRTSEHPPCATCSRMAPTVEEESQVPTVRLLQATRLPAQHGKYIRAQVDGPQEKTLALFESKKLTQEGVIIEDGAVELDDRGSITLAIQNYGLVPICLKEGLVLGRLQPGEVIPCPEGEMAEGEPAETESGPTQPGDAPPTKVSVATVTAERRRQLLTAVHFDEIDLTSEQRTQLCSLLEDYADVFALTSSELGYTNIVSHSIDTGDHPPIRQPPRRIPFALREKVEEMVEEMLERGVVQPSKSPWASPVVLVAKKDGSTRFCVDYRRLNASTKLDVFPLPRIDDSLDLLSHSRYFTTLDLASGYWQVGMDESSREKTAFVTHSGLFEFSVMPFGLCNAPATFQRLMEMVLAGLAREGCLVYLDDILVVGKTFDEHLKNLRLVLARLQQAGLKLKPSKCHFLQDQVDYLGYVVSEHGISADLRKVEAVRGYPSPADLKSLRSFLGLASYYSQK